MGCRLTKRCVDGSDRDVTRCKNVSCLYYREAEYTTCLTCKARVRLRDGKIVRHEKGLGHMPYRKYHKMSKKSGIPVRTLARENLCDEFKKKVKKDG